MIGQCRLLVCVEDSIGFWVVGVTCWESVGLVDTAQLERESERGIIK
jgi:hypothetical protein